MERLSAEILELYKYFSLSRPILSENIEDIRIDDSRPFAVNDLIDFLRHKKTIAQLLVDKLPATDDSLKQTSD